MTITEMLQKAEEAEALGIPVDYKRLAHLINQAAERQLAAIQAERAEKKTTPYIWANIIAAADTLEELVDGSMPPSIQETVVRVVQDMRGLLSDDDKAMTHPTHQED